MDISKTLKHKITNHSRIFDETCEIYNEALRFIIQVIDKEFADINGFSVKTIVPAVEKLIHVTKSNPHPKYSAFNQRFYKFPSYFRRNAIASAFGKVKSYRSNYNNWLEEKKVALSSGKKFAKTRPNCNWNIKNFLYFIKEICLSEHLIIQPKSKCSIKTIGCGP